MSLKINTVTSQIAASEGLCRALDCGAAKSRMKITVGGLSKKAYVVAYLTDEHNVHFTGNCSWGASGFRFDVWLATAKGNTVPKLKTVKNDSNCSASIIEREDAVVRFFQMIAVDLQKKKDREPGEKSGGGRGFTPPVLQARNRNNKPFKTNQGNIDAWEANNTFDSIFADFLRRAEDEGIMCVGHPTRKSKKKKKK